MAAIETTGNAPVQLLTPTEVAESLRVCRTTVYGLIRTGELESVKVGRRRLITADAVVAYVEGLKPETVGAS